MKRLLATLTATAVLAAAPAAFAQTQCPDMGSIDLDHSGSASLAEVQSVLPSVTQSQFDKADTDGSGSLSAYEYQTLCGGQSSGNAMSPNDNAGSMSGPSDNMGTGGTMGTGGNNMQSGQ